MDLTDQLPWARGQIDLSTASIKAGTNQVHLVAYRGLTSGSRQYYNLYQIDVTGGDSPELVWVSNKFVASDPIQPVILSLQTKNNGYLLMTTGNVVRYFGVNPQNRLISVETTSEAATLNFTGFNRNIGDKGAYIGIWCNLLTNAAAITATFATVDGAHSNFASFDNIVVDANSNYLTLEDTMRVMLLPAAGTFWNNGIFSAPGLSGAGCYTTLPYDTLKTFQDSTIGFTTATNVPATGLPVLGCDMENMAGWTDETYNYCVYATQSECVRGYWYDYCDLNSSCGLCNGVCSGSAYCVTDYGFNRIKPVALAPTPLSCAPLQSTFKKASFWSRLSTTQYVMVAAVIVIGVLVIFGIITTLRHATKHDAAQAYAQTWQSRLHD